MTKEQKPKKSVREYLEGLVWDKKPRLERWLIDYAGASDTPRVRAISRAVLIGAVRRVRHPGCKIDEMLILEGPQGGGKSAALRVMAIDDDWFTDDFPVDVDSGKLVEVTAGKWIVELSELKGMSAGDVAALKAQLSTQQDTARRQPYARAGETVPRQFVIVGTTAATEYLRDTGNRRFWPIRVERFDLDRLRIDRDQIWAEAVVAEAAGEPMRIDARTELVLAAREQLARTDPTDGHLHANYLAQMILLFLGETTT